MANRPIGHMKSTLNAFTAIRTLSNRLLKFNHTLRIHPNRASLRCRDELCDEFLPWLEKKSGVGISSSLYIGKSDYGRSLFASKNVQAGDCLLKVPYSVQITPDNLVSEIKPWIVDDIGNIAKLAVVILVEQKKALASEWAPYITCLPQLQDMQSTLFWSAQELEMIKHSPVFQETVDHQAQIKNDYLTLVHVFDRFPQYFEDVSLENFRHAYGLVTSRARGSTKGVSLIPFADFVNHDASSESFVLNDESEQISEVIADRNYVPDEEVLIRYGKLPNSTLLSDFGFSVPDNCYDQVRFQFDISSDDHLRTMKLDLLQNHCLPKKKGVSFSFSDGLFIIKKVSSPRGKGKGIPQSLRAFARVMSCKSSKELNDLAVEAALHDGRLARRPLANRILEIQAHEILLSHVNDMINAHNVSIKSLQTLEATNCRKRALRLKMAQDLLIGEVQVLNSAAVWLENYCRVGGQIVTPIKSDTLLTHESNVVDKL